MSEELLQNLSEDGVLRITLNRPDVHNAFDDHQILRLTSALEAASKNEDVKILVLESTGKSYSAGGDINYMKRMGKNTYEENVEDAGRLAKMLYKLNFFPRPVIGRVQGAAYGGGVGLVSCCDIAIGTPRVKICLSEVKVGVVPATIAPYVVRTIGEKNARRLFMTAEVVDAESAMRMGFLAQVVEEDQLDVAVDARIKQILDNSPNAVGVAKQLVFDVSSGVIDQEMMDATGRLIAEIRGADEGREGLSAFLERRAPSWQEKTE